MENKDDFYNNIFVSYGLVNKLDVMLVLWYNYDI